MTNPIKCKHIECNNTGQLYGDYCLYHFKGGIFGNGETYEQYQIIEQDFIDFIKIVPLNDEDNLKVYSPVLRDIIIRCCVQIEVFLKEWSKFHCNYSGFETLLNLYSTVDKKTQTIKGAKNWNFVDYYPLKKEFINRYPIYIRELNKNIEPFSTWTSAKDIPDWWNVYNAIKHDGINSKKKVNLEITIDALSALFTLHCCNPNSREYLKKHSSIKIISKSNRLYLKYDYITTPLDSKKYLFSDVNSSHGDGIEIEKSNRNQGKLEIKGKKN